MTTTTSRSPMLPAPQLGRRAFLARTGAALAAGTVASLGAVVATRSAPVAVSPSESSDLLALGKQIDPLLAAYRAAVEHHRAARATAEASCPAVPDELVCKGQLDLSLPPEWHVSPRSCGRHDAQWAGCTERECDVEGKDIWPPDYVGADGKTYARAPRNILNAAHTKAAIARGNLYCDRRTRFGKQLSKLIETAERYEAERTAAIEQSGIQNASDELHRAATDLEMLAYEIRGFAPVTMAGVMIHARALAAHGEAELIVCGPGRAGAVLGPELAAAVLRVASGSAMQS